MQHNWERRIGFRPFLETKSLVCMHFCVALGTATSGRNNQKRKQNMSFSEQGKQKTKNAHIMPTEILNRMQFYPDNSFVFYTT